MTIRVGALYAEAGVPARHRKCGGSVIDVTALVTLDKTDLEEPAGYAPASLMDDVDRGLRRVLGL
jgi:mRNA-degrading endonuclease toxin of MazEF toxin-antitoxin module